MKIRATVLFAVLSAGLALSAGPVLGAGLDLGSATDKTLDEFDRPNPHFELGCDECHDGKPEFGKDTPATVKFVNGEEGNVSLCYKCHDSSDNIHPINVDPAKGTPPVVVPKEFPLEARGEHKGKVVCSTCHFIHSKTAGLKLMRGFPQSSDPDDVKAAKFKDRREMCRACHGADLEKKTPHKGIEGDPKSCAFCHATQPKKGEKVVFNKGLIELCDFCHAATAGAHYLLVNPFADPNLKDEVAKANVPMFEGSYSCVSCHDPHGGTKEPKYLRDNFVKLAVKSKRVRPHFQKSLCLSCHKVRPTAPKGSPNAQKLADIPLLSNDMNELCNICHESGLSKSNAHPIVKVTGKYVDRLPKDWPLQNGGLTCLTCHTAGDADTYDPANPGFMRGAPYKTRNEVCWKCHVQAEFREVNPHQDIQSDKGCNFCHDSKPDRNKSIEIGAMKMKSDIVILCIRCHEVLPHPAQSDHNGYRDPKEMEAKGIKIPKEFPLDRKGRLTCATCHNPHAGGDKRGVAVGMEICNACHVNF